MKKQVLLLGALVCTLAATAQDVIVKKSGAEIKTKVLEITDSHIKYRLFSSLNGPIYNVKKSDVSKIRYEEGRTEEFQGESIGDMYSRGANDAARFYFAYREAGNGTLATSIFLTPLIALIPAIAASTTMPSDYRLNCPYPELMNNPEYARGYREKAKSIKSSRVWVNWFAGLLTSAVLVAAVQQ